MAGRRSVFSDPRVIDLAASFVPAADEVWRLQRGADADCRFFQRAINGGELITDKGTRQGIYVFAPSGKLLARINSNSADRVLEALRRGLELWEGLSAQERVLAPDAELDPAFRWEHSYPEEGLVLDRVARDLAGPLDPKAATTGRFNLDFVWFSSDEARSWLPEEPAVGDVHRIPGALAARLARFHLVDNARGQTLPYAAQELREAWFEVEVLAREGERVELALRGETEMVAEGPWLFGRNLWTPRGEHPRGIRTQVGGHATFDLGGQTFSAFEAIGFGRRWGRSNMNGRGRDSSPSVVGFHMQLAGSRTRVAPTFLPLYEASWVNKPDDWANHPENQP